MQKNNILLTTNKIIWVSLYILFVWTSYDESGEGLLGVVVIALILTFPSGFLIVYLSQLIEPSDSMADIVFYVCFFIIGYSQWFIVLPWLINKVMSIGKHEHKHRGN